MKVKRIAIAAVAGLAIAAGVAYAAIPDGAGVYTACKLDATGTIRLIDPSVGSSSLLGHCTRFETQITWNQQGQPGATGPAGPQGEQGPQGDPGPSDAYSYFGGGIEVTGPAFQTMKEITVPAGSYVLNASVHFQNNTNVPASAVCDVMYDSAEEVASAESTPMVKDLDFATATMTGVVTNSLYPITLDLRCLSSASEAYNNAAGPSNLYSNSVRLIATKVGTLHALR